MIIYKLTDQDGYTMRREFAYETKWHPGMAVCLPHKANPKLCSPDVIHGYPSMELGLFMNPIHTNIRNPRIFLGYGDVEVADPAKLGTFCLRINRELFLPAWDDKAFRIRACLRFAIMCAEAVLPFYGLQYPKDTRVSDAIESARRVLSLLEDRYAATAVARAATAAGAAINLSALAKKAIELTVLIRGEGTHESSTLE